MYACICAFVCLCICMYVCMYVWMEGLGGQFTDPEKSRDPFFPRPFWRRADRPGFSIVGVGKV